MSRAGLVSLVLLFFTIGLTLSAPVPERGLSLFQRSSDFDLDARSLAMLSDREFSIAEDFTTREYSDLFDREFDLEDEEYVFKRESSLLDAREFEDLESEYTKRDDYDVHTLQRRSKIGQKIKHAFQKVGTFIKHTVAKVAKVYLKVASAVATVAAKVVKFIPGVGNGLSVALKGYAYGANVASDKIHANIGKFSKLTNGLNYVINPMGSAGKAAAKHGGKAGKIASSLLF